jgi:hypothetical protein
MAPLWNHLVTYCKWGSRLEGWSHCILGLLAAGHRVRATVRTPERAAEVRKALEEGGQNPGLSLDWRDARGAPSHVRRRRRADVADLHLRAMINLAAEGERFLAAAGDFMSLLEISRVLRARLGAAAIRAPTRCASCSPSSARSRAAAMRRPSGCSVGRRDRTRMRSWPLPRACCAWTAVERGFESGMTLREPLKPRTIVLRRFCPCR